MESFFADNCDSVNHFFGNRLFQCVLKDLYLFVQGFLKESYPFFVEPLARGGLCFCRKQQGGLAEKVPALGPL